MAKPPIIGITGRKDRSARLHNYPMYSVGQTYVEAILHVGGIPLIIPPVMGEEEAAALVGQLDGLLFSGGEDIAPRRYGMEPSPHLGGVDEQRDASELTLFRVAAAQQKPIFGICRGHQLLNVALGGTLYQDLASEYPDALEHSAFPARCIEEPIHAVSVEPDSPLERILDGLTFQVNSAHHQAVREPGRGMEVIARAPDGVIEATWCPALPFCLSVQWHPEAMVARDPLMYRLFSAFVEAAQRR